MTNLDDWVEINDLEIFDNKPIKNICNKQICKHESFYVSIDGNEFLTDIINSYIDKQSKIVKVCNQVKIDIPRMCVKINNKPIKNFDNFIKKINNFENIKHDTLCNLTELILVLTTQASFYCQFEIINNLYSNVNTKTSVISSTDQPLIDILISHNTIDFLFKKNFECIDVNNENIIYKFCTFLKITIVINNNKCNIESGTLHWFFIK